MYWSERNIVHVYDTNPNLTLADLARMTGKTVQELKNILQRPAPVQHARVRGLAGQMRGKA